MKMSQKTWITHRWPLVERSFSRATCLQWLAEHGYPRPPKSACLFCPYHSAASWRDMRDNDPVSWREAVEFDKAIRPGFKGSPNQAFLHRSLKPLDEVDLRTWEERGQPDLFGEECEGMCGV